MCVVLLQPIVSWGSGSFWMTQMTPALGLKATWKSASLSSGLAMILRYDRWAAALRWLWLQLFCFLLHHVNRLRLRASLSLMHSFFVLPQTLQVEKRESNDDQDDIESNLLLPAGVTLRWATLSLKVFRAEDIPQSKSRSRSAFTLHLYQTNRFGTNY